MKITEVMTDNGSCYRSFYFGAALGDVIHRRTRPYRPQTNGKVERFNRTMLEEWAYVRPYGSETERVEAFDVFLHLYNHHRGHTALGGKPPISRVNDLHGQSHLDLPRHVLSNLVKQCYAASRTSGPCILLPDTSQA